MVASKVVKKNISGMQVLKTLQVLLEGNYKMSELLEKLNANEKEPFFNNSVVSKYINTCRFCGIDISKINNRYYISSMPFGLHLSQRDVELLAEMQNIARKIFSTKFNKNFDKFLLKIDKYSNKQLAKVEKRTIDIVYERFYKAISQKRRILLIFKIKTVLEVIPVDIIDIKGRKMFKVIDDNNNEQLISVEKISGLEILDKKFKEEEQTVTFKLYEGLASRYTLREYEEILTNNLPEYIVVKNIGEEKDKLISRLLRYDSKCEIISPQSYRDEIKAMLNKMLENYGEK